MLEVTDPSITVFLAKEALIKFVCLHRHPLRGYCSLQKKCPRAVPTGLRSAFAETAFPR